MKVFFVGAGPGDPELLTRKAERLIREARICIYAGSLVSPEVLALLPEIAEKHNSAGMSLEESIAVMAAAAHKDTDVVRLHTGDPSLYSAIREQMEALDRLGIDYEVVPGVSAFQAAAAALRLELTAPEVAQTVILTRTAGRTPVPEKEALDRLAATGATLCIFLSIHKIGELATILITHYGAACPVAVIYHASRPDERIITGRLDEIARKTEIAHIAKTAIILVGPALARGGARSKLYDGAFTHEYRAGITG